MARFFAEIEGNRPPVQRLGDSKSGIFAKADGMDVGIEVTGLVNNATGKDMFVVEVTGGSNDLYPNHLVLVVERREDGSVAVSNKLDDSFIILDK